MGEACSRRLTRSAWLRAWLFVALTKQVLAWARAHHSHSRSWPTALAAGAADSLLPLGRAASHCLQTSPQTGRCKLRESVELTERLAAVEVRLEALLDCSAKPEGNSADVTVQNLASSQILGL